jgi:mannitol-specific phosphotransferase system IIBC component
MAAVAVPVAALLAVVGVNTTSATGATAPTHTTRAEKIAAVRHATHQFRSVAKAEAAGYGLLTDVNNIACITDTGMGMGAMGYHFVRGDLVGNPAVDIRHPEAVIYRTGKGGRMVLSAVEYVVIAKAWNATHSGPPQRFGHKFMLTKAPNRYGLPNFYSLHAWVWMHNPAGRFAPFNPNVHCP